LTCDGLGALVLALAALVGFTAAVFSWGYIANRGEPGRERKVQRYYGLYNLFVLSMLAVPLLSNVALMWIAVELTTLLSAFLVGPAMSEVCCKRCGAADHGKNGIVGGVQRYRCLSCGCNFTMTPPRGKPPAM
jgi:NADH:ubiquinone oxidoreductase subunit 5 (subunit L)/multisubunit Na+/H+ antiporter MnhA subunit